MTRCAATMAIAAVMLTMGCHHKKKTTPEPMPVSMPVEPAVPESAPAEPAPVQGPAP